MKLCRCNQFRRLDPYTYSGIFRYCSVPLIRPPIMYTTSSPKRGGGVFSSTQLVSIIRPLTKFRYVYDTAKVHVHSYKNTNDRQYCSWSSCMPLHGLPTSIGEKSCTSTRGP